MDILVILGICLAVVLTFCALVFAKWEQAKRKKCMKALHEVSVQGGLYYSEQEPPSMPQSLSELAHPPHGKKQYLRESDLLDPWGNPLIYERLDAHSFRVLSKGRDGLVGTDDDLVYLQERARAPARPFRLL